MADADAKAADSLQLCTNICQALFVWVQAELCSTEERLKGEAAKLDRMSQRLQCHL